MIRVFVFILFFAITSPVWAQEPVEIPNPDFGITIDKEKIDRFEKMTVEQILTVIEEEGVKIIGTDSKDYLKIPESLRLRSMDASMYVPPGYNRTDEAKLRHPFGGNRVILVRPQVKKNDLIATYISYLVDLKLTGGHGYIKLEGDDFIYQRLALKVTEVAQSESLLNEMLAHLLPIGSDEYHEFLKEQVRYYQLEFELTFMQSRLLLASTKTLYEVIEGWEYGTQDHTYWTEYQLLTNFVSTYNHMMKSYNKWGEQLYKGELSLELHLLSSADHPLIQWYYRTVSEFYDIARAVFEENHIVTNEVLPWIKHELNSYEFVPLEDVIDPSSETQDKNE
jgi:hypothetical protein